GGRDMRRRILWAALTAAFCLAGVCGQSACAQERGIADFPKLAAERDWPWWRGPSRNGIAAGAAPTKFTESDAVWKTPVPGRGHSSPVVVGDRVFLTTADMQAKSQHALAIDRRTGKQL